MLDKWAVAVFTGEKQRNICFKPRDRMFKYSMSATGLSIILAALK